VVNSDDLLCLAFVGMHPDRRRQLVSARGGVRGVLQAVRDGQVEVPDRARQAALVGPGARRTELEALGINVVVRGDPGFPEHLAELPDAPDLLFVRGSMASDRGVAVVGSRQATSYGLGLARAYGAALASAGWPVISGLARGVDGAAHRGTLDVGGRGAAVLGCGLDVWYPPEHRGLGEELLDSGGCIVSEYPPGAPPLGWRFPPRNRIISGLAAAVVVVEAAKHGGALITARLALEQGRDVLAVPGDVDRPTSEGCNLLIRDGANPVLGPEDLVEAISLILGPAAVPSVRLSCGHELVDALGPVGRSVDSLATTLGLAVSDVLAQLARLETAGVVVRSGGLVMRRGVSSDVAVEPFSPTAETDER
jgi:DNA processing protein